MQYQVRWQKEKKNIKGFTLVEIMIVVLIIGILLAIAVPNFVRAREATRQKSCVGNLRKIQYAKDSYMMDKNKDSNTPQSAFTDTVLYGNGITGGYLASKPLCPGGGVYTAGDGDVLPVCDYNNAAFPHLYSIN